MFSVTYAYFFTLPNFSVYFFICKKCLWMKWDRNWLYCIFFSSEIMIDPINPIITRALTSTRKCKRIRVNRVNFSSFRSIEFIFFPLFFISFYVSVHTSSGIVSQFDRYSFYFAYFFRLWVECTCLPGTKRKSSKLYISCECKSSIWPVNRKRKKNTIK